MCVTWDRVKDAVKGCNTSKELVEEIQQGAPGEHQYGCQYGADQDKRGLCNSGDMPTNS